MVPSAVRAGRSPTVRSARSARPPGSFTFWPRHRARIAAAGPFTSKRARSPWRWSRSTLLPWSTSRPPRRASLLARLARGSSVRIEAGREIAVHVGAALHHRVDPSLTLERDDSHVPGAGNEFARRGGTQVGRAGGRIGVGAERREEEPVMHLVDVG